MVILDKTIKTEVITWVYNSAFTHVTLSIDGLKELLFELLRS